MGAVAALVRDRDVGDDDREAMLVALALTMMANGADELVDDDVRARVASFLAARGIDLAEPPDVLQAKLNAALGNRANVASLAEACASLMVGQIAQSEADRGQQAGSRLGVTDGTAGFVKSRSDAPPAGAVKASPLLRFQAMPKKAADSTSAVSADPAKDEREG